SRVHLRVTPGAVGLVREISPTSLPATPCRTAETAAEVMQCAQGYSGCIGVSPSGNHEASRGVARLLVWSGLRMAVTGRQRLYAYLASKTAIIASAPAIDTRAKRRAQSTTSMSFAIATCRIIGL